MRCAEDRELASEAVDLGKKKKNMLIGTICARLDVTHHCLLFLLELEMEIRRRQRTRVAQRPRAWAHAGVVTHRRGSKRARWRETRGQKGRRAGGVDGVLVRRKDVERRGRGHRRRGHLLGSSAARRVGEQVRGWRNGIGIGHCDVTVPRQAGVCPAMGWLRRNRTRTLREERRE